MKIFDLSHALVHGSCVYPGDPECRIETVQAYQEGYFVSRIAMSTHTGTHVDAPAHRFPGGKSLTDLAVQDFMAESCALLDCRGLDGEIDAAFLKAHAGALAGCSGVILRTGWAKNWGTDAFFRDFPGVSGDAAAALQELGIRIIGVETPSLNCKRDDDVHSALLGAGIVVVEALCGLEQLEGYFEFYALPLKLEGRDGSPVRAFAIQR